MTEDSAIARPCLTVISDSSAAVLPHAKLPLPEG